MATVKPELKVTPSVLVMHMILATSALWLALHLNMMCTMMQKKFPIFITFQSSSSSFLRAVLHKDTITPIKQYSCEFELQVHFSAKVGRELQVHFILNLGCTS